MKTEKRRCIVIISTHYYILSLGAKTVLLFEGFRDFLIEVENQGFPIAVPVGASKSVDDGQLQELARTVDECFASYYSFEPLRLVVVGEKNMKSAFSSVTAHGVAIIGDIEGDHTGTSPRDLGQIVWPVIKEAMSGVFEEAIRDLEAYAGQGKIASGIEAVARAAKTEERATLLVEDGYHVRGSIAGSNRLPIISPDVDVRDVMDDAVDAVIDKVLESGGCVVFTPNGSLSDRNQIVLLLHGAESR